MTLVDIQNNPVVGKVGARASDATVISSELTGNITYYQVENRDNGNVINVNSDESIPSDGRKAKVVSVSVATLKVILKERARYRARVRGASVGAWGGWVNFKTRDKRYQTPDSITQLSDDTNDTATVKGNRTIVVTNSAKATTVATSRGETVTNTDQVYSDTSSIVRTGRGATVINDATIRFTSRGATIDNR